MPRRQCLLWVKKRKSSPRAHVVRDRDRQHAPGCPLWVKSNFPCVGALLRSAVRAHAYLLQLILLKNIRQLSATHKKTRNGR